MPHLLRLIKKRQIIPKSDFREFIKELFEDAAAVDTGLLLA